MAERPHIFDLTLEQCRELFVAWGLPAFRAQQVMQWVYAHGVTDPVAMTNLAASDRALLGERMRFATGHTVRHERASDGTQKLLVDWSASPQAASLAQPTTALPMLNDVAGDPSNQTECVMIPAGGHDDQPDDAAATSRERRTACISSQIGCPVGCRFCASGLGGLDGNLTAGQIVEQVWQLQQLPDVDTITHVVFMGMGEPLANFDAVVKAVGILTAPWALGLSRRRITISTVGLPAQIRRLADLEIPTTLAISLHAPNDAIRRQIIPWAEFVSIDQLVDAGRYYFERTGREITLEYILLRGINDQPEHARELAQVARQLRSNVNLIRYNEVASLPFGRPVTEDVLAFQQILRDRGVNVHIRASRGRDIAAACGQLRHEQRPSAGVVQ